MSDDDLKRLPVAIPEASFVVSLSNMETSEARELSLVGKVEMRIALANDASLSKTLNTYLAPLLLKLASDSVSVRSKVSKQYSTILQASRSKHSTHHKSTSSKICKVLGVKPKRLIYHI